MVVEKEPLEVKKEKMDVHLIKLDIDGTITGYNGVEDYETLNPKVEKVIRSLSEDGHIVCLTTGRNFFYALPIYQKAGLKTYMSSYNGAYIINPTHFRSLATVIVIPNQIIKKILKEINIKSNLLNCLVDRDDLTIITTSEEAHYQKLFLQSNTFLKKDNLSDLLDSLGEQDILQMIIEFEQDEKIMNKVFSVLRKYRDAINFYPEKKLVVKNKGDKILYPDLSKITIRIRNKHASKSRGAEIISSYYNIPLERTLAFGNEINDIEIIRTVGKGIVTADSNAYLKLLAHDVTSRDYKLNSDGVAAYLSYYFGYSFD